MNDIFYMRRALELAELGSGNVSPNPLVGAVIVVDNTIIGEGWHRTYGGPHAEVNAINSVTDNTLLRHATIYVTLEPCSHWGKTPPCADLIIAKGIPRVVVGTIDPYCEVCGGGIDKMQQAGIDVITGIMEDECRAINAPFFTAHTLNRPYTTLKWAQTADGYIDAVRPVGSEAKWFTGEINRVLVHKERAEYDAIMVGRKTVEMDDPELTVRNYYGRNPIRITMDSSLRLPTSQRIFNCAAPTILFTSHQNRQRAIEKFASLPTVSIETIDYNAPTLPQILKILACRSIQSLIVEGGTTLLQSFIDATLFDAAKIFTSPLKLAEIHNITTIAGVKAPTINCTHRTKFNNNLFGFKQLTM